MRLSAGTRLRAAPTATFAPARRWWRSARSAHVQPLWRSRRSVRGRHRRRSTSARAREVKAEVDHAHLCACAAEAQLCTSPWVEVRPITARPHTRPRTPTRDFFRVSHARARGPVHARSMRTLPARLCGARAYHHHKKRCGHPCVSQAHGQREEGGGDVGARLHGGGGQRHHTRHRASIERWRLDRLDRTKHRLWPIRTVSILS